MSTAAIPTPVRAPASSAGFVSHARLISVLTLLSRILGMLRETVVATYFGAGVVSAAFTVAFKIPNLFRKLLGEGAISAAFIPLYAQALKSGNRQDADRFAAASVNLLTIILLALTILGEAGLWTIAHFVHLRSQDLLVVRFTAIMLPYVLLVCLTGFLSGILQVHKRFALPALTPVLLNVIHIAVIMVGARVLWLSTTTGDLLIQRQTRLAYWLAGFVLVAGVFQVAMLLPALRAVGFSFSSAASFWSPRVKKMLTLTLPVAMSAGVLQISVIVDTAITVYLTGGQNPADRLHFFGHTYAYPLALGAVPRLNWAQFLYQFPLGVFATALATAIFPGLSGDAFDTDRKKFNRVLEAGILFALLESIPASAGLVLVRYPVIRLLFQHGSFTAYDTRWVALSTVFYASAIWAFSLQQVLNRAYYALHDTMTPFVLSIVTIVVNTVVEVPLCFTRLGEAGMAVGTLASFGVQAIIMLWILDRKTGGLGLKSITTGAGKMVIACALMIAACLAAQHLPIYSHGTGHWASMQQLAILLPVGAATYGAACWAMHLFPSPATAGEG
jgi:putative peptidoglycan lipid II flippase